MHRADVSIPCFDPAQARVLHAAVQVEAVDGPAGTTTDLHVDGACIQVHVTADDLSGLRAAMHGVLRLLDTAERVADA